MRRIEESTCFIILHAWKGVVTGQQLETRIWPPVGFQGKANGDGDDLGGQRKDQRENKVINDALKVNQQTTYESCD